MYGVHAVFLAGKSPNTRSYTVYVYGQFWPSLGTFVVSSCNSIGDVGLGCFMNFMNLLHSITVDFKAKCHSHCIIWSCSKTCQLA